MAAEPKPDGCVPNRRLRGVAAVRDLLRHGQGRRTERQAPFLQERTRLTGLRMETSHE